MVFRAHSLESKNGNASKPVERQKILYCNEGLNMNKDVRSEIDHLDKADDPEEIQSSVEEYTQEEIDNAIEVIKILIKVRDRARKEGKINW